MENQLRIEYMDAAAMMIMASMVKDWPNNSPGVSIPPEGYAGMAYSYAEALWNERQKVFKHNKKRDR